MSVKRAVLPDGCGPSRTDVVFALAVSCLLVACSFETQPLFEPSRSDPATGSAISTQDAATAMDAADPSSVVDAGSVSGPSSAADAGTGGASVCQPLQVMSCSAGRALTCRADGSGFDALDCGAAGCNLAANGCNACLPDRSTCDGNAVTRCSPDGKVMARETCALGCVGVVGGQASCRVCEPGASMCNAKGIARCAPDGMSWQTQKCADGCDAATRSCVGARLVPVNLPRDACRLANVEDHDQAGELEVDTDEACTRVIQQPAGQPEICLNAYRQLRVRAGAVIRVHGSRVLALVATKSMRLEGRISVSAHGSEPGPGSVSGPVGVGQPGIGRLADGTPGPSGDTVDWDTLPANAGGGGGGYATPGAPGGDAPGMCGQRQACASGGLGGAMHGSEQLSPLHGGAHGGANSAADESSRGNEAGGGGGAIQLVACEELLLGDHAVIDANGGGGEGGGSGSLENAANETPGAGAGGGSGGAILIQARTLRASAGSVLVANGGGGGGGASRSNNAREPLSDGENGQDGLLSSQAAAGGAPAGTSQPGGAGGALTPPVPGGTAKMRTQAAGGGGGAAGRIRIEIGPGDAILQGVVISPSASRGSVLIE